MGQVGHNDLQQDFSRIHCRSLKTSSNSVQLLSSDHPPKSQAMSLEPDFDISRKHFEEIDSTNTWTVQNLSSLNVKQLHVISASSQTAGRGRFTRYAWS